VAPAYLPEYKENIIFVRKKIKKVTQKKYLQEPTLQTLALLCKNEAMPSLKHLSLNVRLYKLHFITLNVKMIFDIVILVKL